MNLTVKSLYVIAVLSFVGLAQQGAAQPGRGPAGPMASPGYGAPGIQSRQYGPAPTNYRGAAQRPGNTEPTRFGSGPGSSYTPPPRGLSPSYPPGYSPVPNRNIAPRNSVPADTTGMQQALRQQDYNRIGEETQGVRSRTKDIQQIGPELPAGDRMKLPLIGHMYRQGADIIDEGRDSKDPSKIKMGIQQINDANEKFRGLENPKGDSRDKSGRGRKNR